MKDTLNYIICGIEMWYRIVPLHCPPIELIFADEEVNNRPIRNTGEIPSFQFLFMSGDGGSPMIICWKEDWFLLKAATQINEKLDERIFITERIGASFVLGKS